MSAAHPSESRSAAIPMANTPGGLARLYPLLRTAGPGSVLLETGGPNGVSLVAWDPAAAIRVREGRVEMWADPRASLPDRPSSPRAVPHYLDEARRRFGSVGLGPDAPPLPFCGGFVGYVGYEWAVAQEGPDAPRLGGFPDIWFGLFDRAILESSDGTRTLVVAPSIRNADPRVVRRTVEVALQKGAPARAGSAPEGSPTPSWTRLDFERAVRQVRQRIRRGDVYQANLALRLEMTGVDPWSLYRGIRARNPSPFSGFLEAEGTAIASASPERLLRVTLTPDGGRLAETRPIAGTRPRGHAERDLNYERSLRRSPKERAEHTMLVDLSRNDLGRVCTLGSVEVDEWLTVERYSHVMHLVSNVRGRLPAEVGLAELFRALMPGGSVTGTPKIRATEVIHELEPVPRGPFTGSLGYVSLDGQMDFNLLIRSAFFPSDRPSAMIYAGAGIVQDSRPECEWQEVRAKAAVLLEAASGSPSRGFPWEPPRRYSSWRPPSPPRHHVGRRVLLIDNYDSFTYNLAQYLSTLGAQVRVVRNDAESLSGLLSRRPTHVVLSPGPGRPEESGVTVPAVRAFEGTPLLGVCLGHQAIIEAYGGSLGTARLPVHGKSSAIHRVDDGQAGGLLRELRPRFRAARYHSLVARTVPDSLRVTARTVDGEVMAVEHRQYPTFGVQFHPESLRTELGMLILDRFLATEPPP